MNKQQHSPRNTTMCNNTFQKDIFLVSTLQMSIHCGGRKQWFPTVRSS